MKILIAYDGSESADKGIDDLSRAGLPVEVEALVVSVAEVWLPPPRGEFDDTFPLQMPAGLKRAREHAAQIVKDRRYWFQQSHRTLPCGQRVSSSGGTCALFGRSGSHHAGKMSEFVPGPKMGEMRA